MHLLLCCCCFWCLLQQGALSELLSGGDFEAKQGSASRALRLGKPTGAAAGPRYVALLGLGKGEALAKPAGERYGANPYQVRAALQLCLVGYSLGLKGDSDTEQTRREWAWHVLYSQVSTAWPATAICF
jgi:hypothetical protein